MMSRNSEKFRHNVQAQQQHHSLPPHQHNQQNQSQQKHKESLERYTRLSDDDDLILQREKIIFQSSHSIQLPADHSLKGRSYTIGNQSPFGENFYENLQFCQHRESGGHIYGKLRKRDTRHDDDNIYENICENCGGFYSNLDKCDKCVGAKSDKAVVTPKRKFFGDIIGNLILKTPKSGTSGGGNKVKKAINRLEIVHNVDQVFKTNKTFDLNEICLMKNSASAPVDEVKPPVELRKPSLSERKVNCHSDDHLLITNRRHNIHEITSGCDSNAEQVHDVQLRNTPISLPALQHEAEIIRSFSDNSNLMQNNNNKTLLNVLRDNLAKLKRNSSSLTELPETGTPAPNGNYHNHFITNSDENLNTIRRKNILYYPQFSELISKEFPPRIKRNTSTANTIYENILFANSAVTYNCASVQHWISCLKRETTDYPEEVFYNIKAIPSRSFDSLESSSQSARPSTTATNPADPGAIATEFKNQINDFRDNLNGCDSKRRFKAAPIANSNSLNQPIRIVLRTPSYVGELDNNTNSDSNARSNVETITNSNSESLLTSVLNEFDIALNNIKTSDCIEYNNSNYDNDESKAIIVASSLASVAHSRVNIVESTKVDGTTPTAATTTTATKAKKSNIVNSLKLQTQQRPQQQIVRCYYKNLLTANDRKNFFYLLNNNFLSVSLNKIALITDIYLRFYLKYSSNSSIINIITNSDRLRLGRNQNSFSQRGKPQQQQQLQIESADQQQQLIRLFNCNRSSVNRILSRLVVLKTKNYPLNEVNSASDGHTMKEISDFYKKDRVNQPTMTNNDGDGHGGDINRERCLKKRLSDFDLSNKFSSVVAASSAAEDKMKIDKFFKCDKVESGEKQISDNENEKIMSMSVIPSATAKTTMSDENIYQSIWKCKTDGIAASDYEEERGGDGENIYADLNDFRKQTDDDEWEIADEFDYSADSRQFDDFINNNVMMCEKSDMKEIPVQFSTRVSNADYSQLCILFNTLRPELNRIYYNYQSNMPVLSNSISAAQHKHTPIVTVTHEMDLVKKIHNSENFDFNEESIIEWKQLMRNSYYADDEEDVIMADELPVFKDTFKRFVNTAVNDKLKGKNLLTSTTTFVVTPSAKNDVKSKSSLSLDKLESKTPSPILGGSPKSTEKEGRRGFFSRSKAKVEAKTEEEDSKSIKSENDDDSDKGSGKVNLNSDIPRFVVECIEIIQTDENIRTHGLYRASGNKNSIENIIKKISDKKAQKSNFKYDFLKKEDVHSLTSALKQYFRNSKTPLVPDEIYQDCMKPNCSVQDISLSIKKLETKNRETLKFVIQHLKKVNDYSSDNMMSSSNLSIVWGASIFSSYFNAIASFEDDEIVKINKLVLDLIDNYDVIFEN